MRDEKGKFKKQESSVEPEYPHPVPMEEKDINHVINQPLTLKTVLILMLLVWLLSTFGKDIFSPMGEKGKDFVSSHYCKNYTVSAETIATPTRRKEG